MAHEKVYGICEDKCRVDITDKLNSGGGATTDSNENFVVGTGAMPQNQKGKNNVVIGKNALNGATSGGNNVAIGLYSMEQSDSAGNNIAIGSYAMQETDSASNNVAIGVQALQKCKKGEQTAAIYATDNVGIGYNALTEIGNGGSNVGIGRSAGSQIANGRCNTVIGAYAFLGKADADGNHEYGKNTVIGAYAMQRSTGNNNTAIGYNAANDLTYDNITALGYQATVTGDNQVQLGNADTTTYCYNAVQNRSDARDKTDIQNTDLGLEFIDKLRPVKFRWDYREAYREYDDEGNVIEYEKDGSRAGKRFHQGLIAQEVKQVMDELGVDFAGYQDHSVNGGKDVLSIGYTELIGPMIKAIQELSAEVQQLKSRLDQTNK